MMDYSVFDPFPEITLLVRQALNMGYAVEHDGGGIVCIFRSKGDRLRGVLFEAGGTMRDLSKDVQAASPYSYEAVCNLLGLQKPHALSA